LSLQPGKGSFFWKKTGNLYDGDWKDDHRDGYGALSVLKKNKIDYRKQYIGGWKAGRKHVCICFIKIELLINNYIPIKLDKHMRRQWASSQATWCNFLRMTRGK